MIITRTPTRISLCGGGSEYPASIKQWGGLVVGGAISHYSYHTVKFLPPFHPHKTRLAYSEIEHVTSNDDVSHRAIRAVMQHLGVNEGIDSSHASDLPSRCGVGSSSAFVVGLLNALSALKGKVLLPQQLAHQAIHIEQDLMGETVGSQDQCFASWGGLRAFRFHQDGKIGAYPVVLDAAGVAELESWLMLFFTGQSRSGMASDVASTYVPELTKRHARHHFAQVALAEQAVTAIEGRQWATLGALMDRGWELKRGLSPTVSSPVIDAIYADARVAGAAGGKLLGAGGGGILALVVDPKKQGDVVAALPGLLRVPFSFDFSGSRIIHCDVEGR